MAHTPWGEIPVNDAHLHFFSHPFYTALAGAKGLADAGQLEPLLHWEIPPRSAKELATQWKAELDRKGVERAALIASVPGDEASVAEAVETFPDRFYGHFMVNPLAPDAVERVAAASANPFLHCLCLFPALHRFSVNDPAALSILEIAAASHLAVFVHCGAFSLGVRKKLGLPNHFDLRFSNPLEIHPVAARFSKLRFLIPHFGAGMLRETLMLADLCPNVWIDTSSSNRWMDYEGLDLPRVFERTINLIGTGRLLFGTDSSYFPRGWNAAVFEQQTAALSQIGISAEQAKQIFCVNLELFHGSRKR